MDDRPGFEAALAGLEAAVEALESGELGLDEALRRYEEGVRLLAQCQALLEGAERRVALLTGLDGAGNPVVAAFDASATGPRETGTIRE
jgi:exodeoxyribonuclease VII small subunit